MGKDRRNRLRRGFLSRFRGHKLRGLTRIWAEGHIRGGFIATSISNSRVFGSRSGSFILGVKWQRLFGRRCLGWGLREFLVFGFELSACGSGELGFPRSRAPGLNAGRGDYEDSRAGELSLCQAMLFLAFDGQACSFGDVGLVEVLRSANVDNVNVLICLYHRT